MPIRLLIQFIVMNLLRFVLTDGFEITFNIQAVFLLILMSITLTLLFESYDHLLTQYTSHKNKILTVLFILLVGLIYVTSLSTNPLSTYQQTLSFYVLFILIKDTFKVSSINEDLLAYQKKHQ